jgi:hypothetical protein
LFLVRGDNHQDTAFATLQILIVISEAVQEDRHKRHYKGLTAASANYQPGLLGSLAWCARSVRELPIDRQLLLGHRKCKQRLQKYEPGRPCLQILGKGPKEMGVLRRR